MTSPDKAHITLVCDRSGSMQAVLAEAEGGINALIKEQQETPGDCSLLLVDFDTTYRVHHSGPIGDCPPYKLEPRGMTALLDAVGRAITETGELLAAIPEDERPGRVIFAVQTDGQENSSHEFTNMSLRAMVNRQHDEFAWEFVFLGTGVDTWGQGGAMGIANVTRAAAGGVAMAASYANTSDTMSRFRTGTVMSMADTNVDVDVDGVVAPTG